MSLSVVFVLILGLLCLNGVAVGEEDTKRTTSTNNHEGEALMMDIKTFLNNEAVPQKLKDAFKEDMDALVLADSPGDSPYQVKGLSGGRDCCTVQPPPRSESYVVNLHRYYTYYRTHTWQSPCGLFGWDRCKRSKTKSETRLQYYTLTYYRSVAQLCSVYDCCSGKMWLDGTGPCVDIEQTKVLLEQQRIKLTSNL